MALVGVALSLVVTLLYFVMERRRAAP
jgi:hypothetical protein